MDGGSGWGEVFGGCSGTGLVGRVDERAELAMLLEPDGPLAVFVTGIGGIGKSTLLRAFLPDVRAAGMQAVTLDCRTVEPTERGFVAALGHARGEPGDLDAALHWLAGLGPALLVLDGMEHLVLLDAWLRQEFVPRLPPSCRVLGAARQLPLTAWRASGARTARVRAIALGPLSVEDSRQALDGLGVTACDVDPIVRFTRGHPLALEIAAAATTTKPLLPVEDTAFPAVIDDLVGRYLAELDGGERAVLDAAALVRRVTIPVLEAMNADDPAGAYERLRRLAFVEASADGLFLHETFQQALATDLASRHPSRARLLRRAAWDHLRQEAAQAGDADLWRCTADMLFLVGNPVVREAFFPSAAQAHVVERAVDADAPAITALIETEEPRAVAEWLTGWWHRAPETFSVARDRAGTVDGVCSVVRHSQRSPALPADDPVAAVWRSHLARHPLSPDQEALLLLRWLSRGRGELPAPAQAAMWLDIKRLYMELRPRLTRLYTVVADLDFYAPIVTPLGFEPIGPVQVGSQTMTACFIDFGPGSVDGWLSRLVAAELDDDVGDAELLALTPLEKGTWAYLTARPGRAVSRVDLIEHVWGSSYAGGSNVVDAVVRTLRRKLGDRAEQLETVRGVGYRFRG